MSPQWRWHQLIYFFVQELNKTEEDVYEMNYIGALNWQGFFKEKRRIEKNAEKNAHK